MASNGIRGKKSFQEHRGVAGTWLRGDGAVVRLTLLLSIILWVFFYTIGHCDLWTAAFRAMFCNCLTPPLSATQKTLDNLIKSATNLLYNI